jgi:hypothetical protein
MFVDKNILAGAIAEGQDPSAIAEELIAALNEAIIMNREAEEAKRAAEAERAQLESAGILLAAFTSYIADYCPNMLDMMENEEDDLEPEDIVEIMAMMDEGFVKSKEWVDKMAQGVNDLLQMFIPKEVETAGGPDLQPLQVEPGTTPKMPVSISDFLKANGL